MSLPRGARVLKNIWSQTPGTQVNKLTHYIMELAEVTGITLGILLIDNSILKKSIFEEN